MKSIKIVVKGKGFYLRTFDLSLGLRMLNHIATEGVMKHMFLPSSMLDKLHSIFDKLIVENKAIQEDAKKLKLSNQMIDIDALLKKKESLEEEMKDQEETDDQIAEKIIFGQDKTGDHPKNITGFLFGTANTSDSTLRSSKVKPVIKLKKKRKNDKKFTAAQVSFIKNNLKLRAKSMATQPLFEGKNKVQIERKLYTLRRAKREKK